MAKPAFQAPATPLVDGRSRLVAQSSAREEAGAPESLLFRFRYQLGLTALTVFTVLLNTLWFPNVNADGYIWVPITRELSAIATSDGRHRFLFALPAWAMYHLCQLIAPVERYSPAEFARIGNVWRVENAAFYALSVWFAFDGMRRLTESARFAFFFATFVATSAHFFLNLSFACVNLHGFFVNYLTLWLCAVYVTSSPEKQRQQIIPFSLLFGTMMLGKAHYNIVGALALYVLAFERRYLKDVVIFGLLQFVPLLLWAKVILPYGLHSQYANYEFARPGYSLADYWHSAYLSKGFPRGLFALFDAVRRSVWSLISTGMGFGFWLVFLLGVALTVSRPIGALLLGYILITDLYLVLANFSLPRHAEDFGPALYFYGAMLVSACAAVLPRRVFFVSFALLVCGMMYRNYNLDRTEPIHGASFIKDFNVPTFAEAFGI
ncbi:MAG: hypothetical protein U0136_12870 [Bdellovibrionota bacterium]